MVYEFHAEGCWKGDILAADADGLLETSRPKFMSKEFKQKKRQIHISMCRTVL